MWRYALWLTRFPPIIETPGQGKKGKESNSIWNSIILDKWTFIVTYDQSAS